MLSLMVHDDTAGSKFRIPETGDSALQPGGLTDRARA